MSSAIKKISLLLNTAKYLKPSQIYYQVVNIRRNNDHFSNYASIYKPELVNRDLAFCISALDLDHEYLSRFSPEDICDGVIELLNYKAKLPDTWHDEKATHLWSFNLHYFEYAIAMANAYMISEDDRFVNSLIRLFEGWKMVSEKSLDALHPYTVSLRIRNLMIVASILQKGKSNSPTVEKFTEDLYQSVYPQYRYLECHQEKHLLGNHYLENLVSIYLCALLFQDRERAVKYRKKLLNELNEQILEDGVHYERSLMYHKLILEDVIRVAVVESQASEYQDGGFIAIAQKMLTALASIEKGMGKTPFFNDAADRVAKRTEALVACAEQELELSPKYSQQFVSSGYYKYYRPYEVAVLIDCGEIGPRHMPGHGHCDALSFEMSMNGEPVIVNSGTYNYQSKKRKYFRSTAAHNTATLNSQEQSECWGEHRVARRIRGIKAEYSSERFAGQYVTFYGTTHKRQFEFSNSQIIVTDAFIKANGEVQSFLHIAPGIGVTIGNGDYELKSNGKTLVRIEPLNCISELLIDGEMTCYSPEFGKLQKATVIRFVWDNDVKRQHGYIISCMQ